MLVGLNEPVAERSRSVFARDEKYFYVTSMNRMKRISGASTKKVLSGNPESTFFACSFLLCLNFAFAQMGKHPYDNRQDGTDQDGGGQ